MGRDRILIVEDEAQFSGVMINYLESKGYEAVASETCAGAKQVLQAVRPDLAILDYSLPDGNALDLLPEIKAIDPTIPIIVLTAHGSIDLAVHAIKLGAEQFLTKPTELSVLLMMIQRSIENRRNHRKLLIERNRQKREEVDPFMGRSLVIRKLAELAQRVVAADSPVLIQGETGTGKGVLARWFHEHGPRTAEAFVDLNCGGFSRDLLESELFGYEKGAFTGAVQSKPGLLEIAHKGTVFLDEIGDVDLQIQPKLLKVLEEKRFRRLGDVRDRRVDIRLVAATNQDLAKLARERKFRNDLYFRISTIPLVTPPLRERVEDIPVLAEYFLGRLSFDLGGREVEISAEAIRVLQSYPWPGNIRELRNVLERAVLLSDSQVLKEKDLHFDVHADPRELMTPGSVRTLEEIERQYIAEVLAMEGGRVETTAKKLGIPRSSLYNKIKQYGIDRPGGAMLH